MGEPGHISTQGTQANTGNGHHMGSKNAGKEMDNKNEEVFETANKIINAERHITTRERIYISDSEEAYEMEEEAAALEPRRKTKRRNKQLKPKQIKPFSEYYFEMRRELIAKVLRNEDPPMRACVKPGTLELVDFPGKIPKKEDRETTGG